MLPPDSRQRRRNLACACLLLAAGCRTEPRHGAYLGEPPPGGTPELFAPGLVSAGLDHGGPPALAPDGNRLFAHPAQRPYVPPSRFERIDGAWAPSGVAPAFVEHEVARVVFGAGGDRVFFSGRRAERDGDAPRDFDLWSVEREGDDWGRPVNLGPPVNSALDEIDFSLAADGTLYFSRERGGTAAGLFYAEPSGSGFAEPRKLPVPGAGGGDTRAPSIAPDESFVVFAAGDPPDLVVSFKTDEGAWGEPVNLGARVNSPESDRAPLVSPDGRYLFFVSRRPVGEEPAPAPADAVWWVSTEVVERLRPLGSDGVARLTAPPHGSPGRGDTAARSLSP